MSKEATGQFGVIMGSLEYWDRLNRTSILWQSGGAVSRTDYHTMLQEVGTRASAAIEEIYQDLSDHSGQIRYIFSTDRNALAKQVRGLYDVCKVAGVGSGHSDDCIHGLDLSFLSPWANPFRDEHAIATAISVIGSQHRYLGAEAVKMMRDAAKWSIPFTAGSDGEKREFLEKVAQGKDSSFLKEVAEEYQNKTGTPNYTGKCGHAIGSQAYLHYIEQKVFDGTLPLMKSATFRSPDYEGFIRDSLHAVLDRLEKDLDDAARENDYITDETADKLKAVADELARCGLQTGHIYSKIEKLAWFVGGDRDKILRLQRDLNALECSDHLLEDGVFGAKTLDALDRFCGDLARGTFPTLAWIDPLQSKKTGIKVGSTTKGQASGLNNALVKGSHRYIRIDPPHSGGKTSFRGKKVTVNYNHINFNEVENSNRLYDWIRERYDHYPLDDDAYHALKDLKSTGKKVRIAGRTLLIGGLALDALELGIAVHADLHDADRKPGKTTVSAAVSIGGSWGGAALGAKAGALLGTLAGPAAPLAIPVLSLTGGIIGSIGGSRLAEYAVDITYEEE